MKLDIACGKNKQKGFKGVDIEPGPDVDYVWDLERYPWEPFKDNTFNEIYVGHYAEYTKDLVKFMEEVWRIAESGAKVTIVAPYYTSMRAWQDPASVRVLTEATWLYFSKEWRSMNKIEGRAYPDSIDFSVGRAMVFFNAPWDKKSEEARQFAQKHYWNAVSEILVELSVIK